MKKILTLLALVAVPSLGFASSFKLSDFAGDFVSVISIAGAPNITAVTPQVAPTITVLTRSSFNKHGEGTVNFISQSVFTGPVAPYVPSNLTTLRTFDGAPELRATVELKDRKKGTGILTVYDYPQGVNSVFDFIAMKGRDGEVKKIFLNVVSNPVYFGVVNFVSERQ